MSQILAILTAILSVLKSTPAIISSIWQIITFFKDLAHKIGQKQAEERLKEALQKARETKDTSEVEKIINGASFEIKLVAEQNLEEKKSPEFSEVKPLDKIESKLKIGNLAAMSALGISFIILGSKKASAAVASFGGNQSSSIGNGTVIVQNRIGQGVRMSSKILPVLICFILLGTTKCDDNQRPVINIKVYAGDSKKQAMVRAHANEEIPSNSPEFDNLVGVKYDDFTCLYDALIKNCKGYYDPNYTCGDR